MAQSECRTPDCGRAGQISGLVKGYCCVICQGLHKEGFLPGQRHALICDMIEEAGNVDIQLGDNIVLGYN